MFQTKKELRAYWMQHRLNLSEKEKNNLSFQISDLLFETVPVQKADHVNIFLPVHEKCEVRTWSIIQYIQEKFPLVNISAPRIKDMKTKTMEAVGIENQTVFSMNKWGIEEPETGPVINPALLDIIFIPLITFDLKGHRLGYGGGFYDRFLSHCPMAKKVGLSYFEPIDTIPQINAFDIALDLCITPAKVYRF